MLKCFGAPGEVLRPSWNTASMSDFSARNEAKMSGSASILVVDFKAFLI